eukprot:1152136-Amphidinium_carterae.1
MPAPRVPSFALVPGYPMRVDGPPVCYVVHHGTWMWQEAGRPQWGKERSRPTLALDHNIIH